MKYELSILIPVFNTVCVQLVSDIRQQAMDADITFEVIVADDGSTDPKTIEANQAINAMDRCRYVCMGQNRGRAAIRNYLAREARYPRLLFIDSHMSVISPQYLQDYLDAEGEVVYGGYIVGQGDASLRCSPRSFAGTSSCTSRQPAT